MPMGVWRLDSNVSITESMRGHAVAFCPPDTSVFRKAKEMGFLRKGTCEGSYMPLLKEVAGLPGDLVEYANGFIINGKRVPNSTIQVFDLGGSDFQYSGSFIVPEGNVWLLNSYSKLSFDSRYFGMVSEDRIVALADPLFVLR